MSTLFKNNTISPSSTANSKSKKHNSSLSKGYPVSSNNPLSVDATLDLFKKYHDLPPLLPASLPPWTKSLEDNSLTVSSNSVSSRKVPLKKKRKTPLFDDDEQVNFSGEDPEDTSAINASPSIKQPSQGLSASSTKGNTPIQNAKLQSYVKKHKLGPNYFTLRIDPKTKYCKVSLYVKPKILRQLRRTKRIIKIEDNNTTSYVNKRLQNTSGNDIEISVDNGDSRLERRVENPERQVASKEKLVSSSSLSMKPKPLKKCENERDSETEKSRGKVKQRVVGSSLKERETLVSTVYTKELLKTDEKDMEKKLSETNNKQRIARSSSSSSTNSNSIKKNPVYIPEIKKKSRPRIKSNVEVYTKFKTLLQQKKRKFIELATDKKHLADKLNVQDDKQQSSNAYHNNSKNAIAFKKYVATIIDSILLFMIGFVYDDDFRNLEDMSANERQWSSLVPLITQVINLLTLENKENNDDIDSFSGILGLCHQLRSLLLIHIKDIHLKKMSNHLNRKTHLEKIVSSDNKFSKEDEIELHEINEKLLDIFYPQFIKLTEDSNKDYLKSELLLNFRKIENFFNETYSKNNKFQNSYFNDYLSNISYKKNPMSMLEYFDYKNSYVISNLMNFSNSENFFKLLDVEKLSNGYFYLPFNPYLNQRQVIAYGYAIVKEWAAKYDVEHDW